MTFQEKIAAALEHAFNETKDYDGREDVYMVDVKVVLAVPDFDALRQWLKHQATSDESNFAVPIGQAMRDWNLSEEFITWVMEAP